MVRIKLLLSIDQLAKLLPISTPSSAGPIARADKGLFLRPGRFLILPVKQDPSIPAQLTVNPQQNNLIIPAPEPFRPHQVRFLVLVQRFTHVTNGRGRPVGADSLGRNLGDPQKVLISTQSKAPLPHFVNQVDLSSEYPGSPFSFFLSRSAGSLDVENRCDARTGLG
ncbi:uncharacterized protein BJX67DRAFT_201730 [Aspergillus lucknowensis]|uniref:Uncharacterized protein n=1 Tax=Aspergillus lucknowensis TaxID=176173 RepID=A0ABR4LJI0_9EURO